MSEPWEEMCETFERYPDIRIRSLIKGVPTHTSWELCRELRAAKAEIERLKTELSKCAWHGAFDEYEEDNRKLRAEMEALKDELTNANAQWCDVTRQLGCASKALEEAEAYIREIQS